MKRVHLLIAVLFFTGACTAQSSGTINLKKGQKFIVSTQTRTHMITNAMGQEIETNNTASGKSSVFVDDVHDNTYTISNTLTNLKVGISMMGQEINYDSDKPDASNPMTAEADQMLNKPVITTIDKQGKVLKTTTPAGDFPELIKQLGGSGLGIDQMFVLVPRGIKVGGTFTTEANDTIAGSRSTFKYTVKAINGSKADLAYTGTMNADSEIENMGMQVHSVMNGTLEGEVTVDLNSGMIQSQKVKTKLKGTANAMGMDMPMEGEVESSVSVTES